MWLKSELCFAHKIFIDCLFILIFFSSPGRVSVMFWLLTPWRVSRTYCGFLFFGRKTVYLSIYLFLSLSHPFWERESELERRRRRQREKIPSRLLLVSKGLNLGFMSWAKIGCLTNWATQASPGGKIFFFNFLTFIYFWERQTMNGGGAEREGDTESETGSRPWAVSTQPDTGLEPMSREIMTWAEVGRPTDWATQAPQEERFLNSWFKFFGYYRTLKALHSPSVILGILATLALFVFHLYFQIL